jgi:hypothetical protein
VVIRNFALNGKAVIRNFTHNGKAVIRHFSHIGKAVIRNFSDNAKAGLKWTFVFQLLCLIFAFHFCITIGRESVV